MTVVHPNHIVGINSITVQTGDSLSVHKADGSLIRTIVSNTGVSTFHAIEVSKGGGDLTVGISTLVVDNSAGKIGIGTVPARTLQVFAATPQLNLKSASGGTCELQFGDTGDEVRANIIYNSTDNYLGFNGYNNTERFRILSNGRIGINTSEATSALQIYAADLGEGTAKGQIVLKDTAAYNASPTAGVVFQGHHASNNAQAIFSGIRGFKANASDGDYDGCLGFDVRKQGAVAYEAMRITEDGDLLLHTNNLNNTAVAGQALQISGTTRPTLILRGNASGSNTGEIQFADNSGSDDDNTGIRAGLIQYDHSNNNMNFRVAGTYTGLKISGTNGRLERNFTGGSNTDDDGMWFNNSGTTSGTFIRFWQTTAGANVVGSISHTTSNTSYNTSSDYRLKENAVSISDGITRLKTLKPYRFNFKTEPSKTVDGFFAHEAATVVPEAVTGTKDEVSTIADTSIGVAVGDPVHQGMDYGKITPLLTAALQEAIAKIEVLETKVAALEGG